MALAVRILTGHVRGTETAEALGSATSMPMQGLVLGKTGRVSRIQIVDKVDLAISQRIRVLARMVGLIAGRMRIASLVLAHFQIWQPATAIRIGAVARTVIVVVLGLAR